MGGREDYVEPLESWPPMKIRYRSYISTAAKLHSVDYERVGLGTMVVQLTTFLGRSVAGRINIRIETDQLQDMEELISWLPNNVPEDETTSIVLATCQKHGDG